MKRTLLALLIAAGCARATTPPVEVVASPELGQKPLRTVAVVPATVSTEAGGVVADGGADAVTDLLAAAAGRETTWTVVSPDRAEGALRGADVPESPVARAGTAATLVEADAALTAVVTRYRERVGSDYGVSEPASVALTLFLVPAGASEIVWKADYAFTQEPLSYNLWNFWGVLRGGPKWLTARELARIGIDEALHRLAAAPGRGSY